MSRDNTTKNIQSHCAGAKTTSKGLFSRRRREKFVAFFFTKSKINTSSPY